MIKFLKNYLIIKWWIPLLLFGLSIFIFINGTIFPNTDFGFYLFILSAFILLTSSIWQLFKGVKVIALLQLSILIIPILFLGSMLYLFAGMVYKPDSELTIESIESLIEEKTDLIIPKDFEVLENLIEHSEGAIDSDYSISLLIQYQDSDEKYITEQILKGMKSKSDKGHWKYYNNGFEFENNNKTNKAEPFYFEVDTLNNKMKLNLSHL